MLSCLWQQPAGDSLGEQKPKDLPKEESRKSYSPCYNRLWTHPAGEPGYDDDHLVLNNGWGAASSRTAEDCQQLASESVPQAPESKRDGVNEWAAKRGEKWGTTPNDCQELNALSWENELTTGRQKHSAIRICNIVLRIQGRGRKRMVCLAWGESELGTLVDCFPKKHGRWNKQTRKRQQKSSNNT